MPRLLSRLSLWSSKCSECSGQPTPPPCYQCTFNLQHPPPNYTSLPRHLLIKTPSIEHSPCLEEEVEGEEYGQGEVEDYNQDETLGLQDRGRDGGEMDQRYRGLEENLQPTGLRTVLTMTESLGRIALAMVSSDDRGQMMEEGEEDDEEEEEEGRAPGTNTHELSSSSPSESYLERFHAAPIVPLDDATSPPSGSTAPPSPSSSPTPVGHHLLTAFTNRFHDTTDLHHFTTSLSTPPSPRGASPLPCQLLVPE